VERWSGSDLTYYAIQSIVGRTINNQVVQNSKHFLFLQIFKSFHHSTDICKTSAMTDEN